MGRPPGSRNKPKTTNGAAPETAGTNGHNESGGVSEAQFFEFTRELESAERRKDAAVSEIRSIRKRMKDGGIALSEYDRARKLKKFTEPEIRGDLNKFIAYAKFLRLPLFSQLDMFEPTEVTDQDRLNEARQLGLVAGKAGTEAARCPWPEETPMGREWLNGHFDGESQMKAETQLGQGYAEA